MHLTRNSQAALAGLFLCVLGSLGAIFLAIVGIAALEGRVDFQFYADSRTYHSIAKAGVDQLISAGSNFFGPVLLLKVLGGNYYAVLCFNLVCFWVSAELICRRFPVSRWLLYSLLLLNPLTISSLLSVNKEIISFLVVALLLVVARKMRPIALTFLIFLALCVRWQMLLFVVVCIGVLSPWNPVRRHRALSIILLVIGVSFAFVLASSIVGGVSARFEYYAGTYAGSGLWNYFVDLQNRGLYWLVFLPKAAHAMFGLGLRFDWLVAPESLYNHIFQLLHSTSLLVMFCLLVARRRVSLRSTTVFMSVVYISIFALSPIYAPRYFYPVYVFWVIEMARRNTTNSHQVLRSYQGSGRRNLRIRSAIFTDN